MEANAMNPDQTLGRSRVGGGGGRGHDPPENHKNIGFLAKKQYWHGFAEK